MLGFASQGSLAALDKWVTPNPELRYDQVCSLGTHNCNSSRNMGYGRYAQQKWSIKQQLANGVRCLLPDIWPTGKTTNKACERKDGESDEAYFGRATIRMCHGPCRINPLLMPKKIIKKGLLSFKKVKPLIQFSQLLETVRYFLNKKGNEKEIVTLCLENYAERGLVDHVIKNVENMENLIFKPRSYEGKWPTLKKLQENGTRLIIFNDMCGGENVDDSKYTFHTWRHVRENEFGKTDVEEARKERGQSWVSHGGQWHLTQRSLLLLNLFPAFPIPLEKLKKAKLIKALKQFKDNTQYKKLNTIKIKELIDKVSYPDPSAEKNVIENKVPNFIALDFVNRGNAMKWVNQINRQQAIRAGLFSRRVRD